MRDVRCGEERLEGRGIYFGQQSVVVGVEVESEQVKALPLVGQVQSVWPVRAVRARGYVDVDGVVAIPVHSDVWAWTPLLTKSRPGKGPSVGRVVMSLGRRDRGIVVVVRQKDLIALVGNERSGWRLEGTPAGNRDRLVPEKIFRLICLKFPP